MTEPAPSRSDFQFRGVGYERQFSHRAVEAGLQMNALALASDGINSLVEQGETPEVTDEQWGRLKERWDLTNRLGYDWRVCAIGLRALKSLRPDRAAEFTVHPRMVRKIERSLETDFRAGMEAAFSIADMAATIHAADAPEFAPSVELAQRWETDTNGMHVELSRIHDEDADFAHYATLARNMNRLGVLSEDELPQVLRNALSLAEGNGLEQDAERIRTQLASME